MRSEKHTHFWLENLKTRDHMEAVSKYG